MTKNAMGDKHREESLTSRNSSAPAPFFDKPREWSKYKHQILAKYVRMWAYKLSSSYTELAFVDACAGEGLYGDGSPGSPLIAAQWNDDGGLLKNGCRLVVHAIEKDPDSANRLLEALEPWATRTPPSAIVYNESFEKALPTLLARTRHVPTLVFIDPYGVRHLTVEQLKPLLKDRRREPTEMLARVDPNLFVRFCGWLQDRPRDQRGKRTATAFRALLDALNLDSDFLAEVARSHPGALSNTMLLFQTYLQMFEERFRWVQIVPIRQSYFALPKYYLVHGTDSPHGAALLNDAVSTTEDSLFEDSARREAGEQLFLLMPARQVGARRAPRVRPADTLPFIRETLRKRGRLQFIELRAELAMRFGPDLREKDHKRALRALVESGEAESVPPGALSARSLITLRTQNAP